MAYFVLMDVVELDKVKKDLKKLPIFVVRKLLEWAKAVEIEGIVEVRKCSGYHDEPLKGKRKGQRSIRLSKSYRAIYVEEKDGVINLIIVEEVNKHEY
jgi:proteic killer suppression protein